MPRKLKLSTHSICEFAKCRTGILILFCGILKNINLVLAAFRDSLFARSQSDILDRPLFINIICTLSSLLFFIGVHKVVSSAYMMNLKMSLDNIISLI